MWILMMARPPTSAVISSLTSKTYSTLSLSLSLKSLSLSLSLSELMKWITMHEAEDKAGEVQNDPLGVYGL